MLAILFILGALLAIIFALLIVFGGWVCTILLSKAISSCFSPRPVHHLLCLGVAVISFVCLQVFFFSQKGINYLNQSEHIVESLVTSNDAYLSQLTEVAFHGETQDELNTSQMLVSLYTDLQEQYPILGRFIDAETLFEDSKLASQLKKVVKGRENVNATVLVRFFSKSIVHQLKRPLVKTCWISIIIFLLFQLLQNFVVLRRAYKSQAFTSNYQFSESSEW